MYATESLDPLQTSLRCTLIYEKTGFDEFFRMKPCEVDARRVHKLITTLEEDGNCTLTGADGEQLLVNIINKTVVKARKLQEGNPIHQAILQSNLRLAVF